MRPSDLQEDHSIQIRRGEQVIVFRREYTQLTVWAGNTPGSEIQISPGPEDADADALFAEIVSLNEGIPAADGGSPTYHHVRPGHDDTEFFPIV